MPYHEWPFGGQFLSPEINTYLARQVVPTFTNASQRSTTLPSPTTGQLSTLDTRPGALSIWTGSAWVDVSPYVQTGETVITTNGAGGASISYPSAFAAPPVVSLIDAGATASLQCQLAVLDGQNLATSVGFICRTHTGAVVSTGNVRVGWVAIGARP